MSQIDERWQLFFDQTKGLREIASKGYLYVKASELKKVTGFEPRLLAKQDTLEQRPKIFARHDLTIFPIENGKYVVFRDPLNKSYYKFSKPDLSPRPSIYNSAVDLRSFSTYPGAIDLTESQVIDFAFTASLIKYHTKETDLNLTIRGRTRSRNFSFPIPGRKIKVEVSGVQIEVDAGFESKTSLYLIEAKIGSRKNFHIRQLYYPYMNWSQISKKRIVPIFLCYTNSKYYFYEYDFSQGIEKIKLQRKECYSMSESPIATVNVGELLNSISDQGEPKDIPYPQANDLNKIIDTLHAIKDGAKTKRDVALFFEFDERQGDYYPNAARYLGYVDKEGVIYKLSNRGLEFLEISTPNQRTLNIIEALLARTTFRKFFELLQQNAWDLSILTDEAISDIIVKHASLSGTTPGRRASTIRQWFKWIAENTKIR